MFLNNYYHYLLFNKRKQVQGLYFYFSFHFFHFLFYFSSLLLLLTQTASVPLSLSIPTPLSLSHLQVSSSLADVTHPLVSHHIFSHPSSSLTLKSYLGKVTILQSTLSFNFFGFRVLFYNDGFHFKDFILNCLKKSVLISRFLYCNEEFRDFNCKF